MYNQLSITKLNSFCCRFCTELLITLLDVWTWARAAFFLTGAAVLLFGTSVLFTAAAVLFTAEFVLFLFVVFFLTGEPYILTGEAEETVNLAEETVFLAEESAFFAEQTAFLTTSSLLYLFNHFRSFLIHCGTSVFSDDEQGCCFPGVPSCTAGYISCAAGGTSCAAGWGHFNNWTFSISCILLLCC
jgi:hypothetical protein